MKVESNNFIELASIAIQNTERQAAVRRGTRNGYLNRLAAFTQFGYEHGQHLRMQAAAAKRRALKSLPDLLEEAEARMTENGITVLWAEDAAEARHHVQEIAARHHVKRIVKSKSMLTEEIELNDVLQGAGLDVVETDLGEYIVQIGGEHPSHIVAPIIHKSKESIRDLMVEKLGMPFTDSSGEMVAFARQRLRPIYLDADMGISGGNFVVAETGTIGLVTNEGNGRLCTSAPRVHVVLVGIEKVVESVEDYALLTQVLPRAGTGQHMTVYTSMINGPRRPDDPDGPEAVYVVLVDNGRSAIYATKYAEVLTCVRCGACQNACPVYRSTGGGAYGWVYGGPIGAVLTPLYVGLENAKPLPYASSLCGACKQVCPVDIDLPRMLLDLRYDMEVRGYGSRVYGVGLWVWSFTQRWPWSYRLAAWAARVGQRIMGRWHPGPIGAWAKYRDVPTFAPKTFHQLWAEREKVMSRK